MKKLLLSLGTVAAVAAPITAVVACGNEGGHHGIKKFSEIQSDVTKIAKTWIADTSISPAPPTVSGQTSPKRVLHGKTQSQVEALKNVWTNASPASINITKESDGKITINWSDLPKSVQDGYTQKFSGHIEKLDLFGKINDHEENSSIVRRGVGLFEVIGNHDLDIPAFSFSLDGTVVFDSRTWMFYAYPEDLVEKGMFTKDEAKKFVSELIFKDFEQYLPSGAKITDDQRFRKIEEVS